MKRLLLILAVALTVSASAADRVIKLNKTPHGWDNHNFAVCYYNNGEVLNIGSYKICSLGKVLDVKMHPTGTSFAVLYTRGKTREVAIYSYIDGRMKHSFRLSDPTAITFTANAKQLCVADAQRNISIFNLSDYRLAKQIPTAFVPQRIETSDNGYFIAGFDENLLYVWNMETGRVRKILEIESSVNDIAFSADNTKMAVLTDRGNLHLYDTKSFSLQETYSGMRDARGCKFHPEGKYICVLTATDRITIINLKNPQTDRQEVTSGEVGIRHIGYAKTVKGVPNLVYNAGSDLVFHPLEELVPDYQKLVRDEVDDLMDDWLRQLPGETLEDYRLRVNDESRALQYSKFENEVATRVAGNQVEEAQVSFGSYNQEESMLEINFDNMPRIYLEVPQEDLPLFSEPEKLKFENSVYTVNQDDQFELIYSEVTNTESGKKYVFDNLEKQSLDYLSMEDDFVPLDLIQQSSMETYKLEAIKQEVVADAQQNSLISEHTHINVKTKVEASTNAEGEKIMNYHVDFNYDVEQEFSAKEDFAPGRYVISQSESALAMLRIVKSAFQNEFQQYIKSGKKVIIQLTGSADAAPISKKIAYGGEYGDWTDALVNVSGELTTLTVTKATGVTTNEQLAFLRALGVKDYVETDLPELGTMRREYDYFANVSRERGAEFRRIGIKFIFVDAF